MEDEKLLQENEILKQAITELKQQNLLLNEQLQRSQQGWSGQWEMDLVSKTVSWSPEVFHMMGIDESVEPNMILFKERLTPIALDRLNGAISKVFVSGKEYSFEHTIQVNEQILNVRSDLKPVYNEQKMPIRLIGKITDITSTKSAQKELEKLSLIAAQTSNAVVMLSIEAEIDWVNSAFTIMTGYRPDEVKGTLFDEIAPEHQADGKSCKEIFADAFQRTHSVIHETKITTKQGKELWVIMNASAVLDYELNAESYIVIITDITDQKEAEAQLAEKNREITDSIKYAKRLQDAMLPDEELIRYQFEDSFIYYRPKDIVSGDFYWMRAPNDIIFVAVADCTGHGVPGAFVSLIGNRALDRSVQEFGLKKPSDILDKISGMVEEQFSSTNSTEVKDGMDICLLAFDLKNKKLMFSGAHNPLYFIRDGELSEMKACKQPIGAFSHRKPFMNYEMDILTGDQFYLFSDGYPDQFGGPKGKKFKYKTFKDLLLEVSSEPMSAQEEILEKRLTEWRGSLDQVDDVCVMGIKV